MPSKEMRKTTIGMRSRRRSPLRNEFEVSPQIFWAECSTRWLSAQHFRSIIQPNYQLRDELRDLWLVHIDERILQDEERLRARLGHAGERALKVLRVTHFLRVEP